MKHYLLLLTTLLLVAASPQLLVEIQDETITGYETTTGDNPTRSTGAWTLELLDNNGRIISQTRYHNDIILPDGTTQALEEIHVPIHAPAAARSISLRDSDGERVSAYEITPRCGDGRCDASERGVCSADCAQETTQLQTQQDDQAPASNGLSSGAWLTIIAAVLLILVLILVLVHLNRKKENPVQIH